jgi:septum formation protein
VRPLLLASTSRFRQALLQRLGVPFRAAAPPFEELAPPGLPPGEVALLFAGGKARSLAPAHPGALIVGSDQVLAHRGEVLHKARDLREAAQQLLRLQGGMHHLHTAVAVLDAASGRLEAELVTVELRMRALTRAQAERYVALDQPHGCAGGYTFEGRGVALFEAVAGGDDSAIVGLPLLALVRLLRLHGWDPLDAW